MAANSTRVSTTVNGPTSFTATAPKKNDPPQRMDSRIRRAHSCGPMTRPALVAVGWDMAIPCDMVGEWGFGAFPAIQFLLPNSPPFVTFFRIVHTDQRIEIHEGKVESSDSEKK